MMRFVNSLARRVLPTTTLKRMRLIRRRWNGAAPAPGGLAQLTVAEFDHFRIAYRADSADEEIIRQSFSNDQFLPAIPEYEPREDDVVIDVGAHIGTFSLLVAARTRTGKVFAIEACQETFNLLRLNVALNRLENIRAEHLALSDRRGQIALYHDRANWGHSTVARLSFQHEMVEAETLGQFMLRNGIEYCDLLRMNCEGAEFPILLNSSADVLQRIRNMLVLYHCDLLPDATEAALESHLQRCGFVTRFAERRASRGWLVALRK